jgi:hypothetical protein
VLTPPAHRRLLALCLLLGVPLAASADPNVAVTAKAREDYTQQKLANGQPAPETYVFMQGNYFDGHTVDRSIERISFRQIAEYLGVQLARQNYLPAPSIAEARLLIVVHWGTTTPRATRQETFGGTGIATPNVGAADIAAFARDNPSGLFDDGMPPAPDTTMTPEANDLTGVADRLIGSVSEGNAATLLGYRDEIHRLGKRAYADAKNDIINFHLTNERYFITLMAYDLKQMAKADTRLRPAWTLHMNISSPGNNFGTALTRISAVVADYAGRSTDGLQTVRPKQRSGTVTIAPLIILGEVNPASK